MKSSPFVGKNAYIKTKRHLQESKTKQMKKVLGVLIENLQEAFADYDTISKENQ